VTKKEWNELVEEYGIELYPWSFQKPLSEITKDEYKEAAEFILNVLVKADKGKKDRNRDQIIEALKKDEF